jgi:hypothetical protein
MGQHATFVFTATYNRNVETIARRFEERWQFPHRIGALDGKHIMIKKPANSGSSFFNYKQTFSVVLMATVDAV